MTSARLRGLACLASLALWAASCLPAHASEHNIVMEEAVLSATGDPSGLLSVESQDSPSVPHALSPAPSFGSAPAPPVSPAHATLPHLPPACRIHPPDSCAFYPDCMNTTMPCKPPHDYAMGYGHRYCSEFIDLEPRFSEYGRAWSRQTRQCLQGVVLAKMASDTPPLTCEALAEFSFGSHAICYAQGACPRLSGLTLFDYWTIVYTIRE